MENAATRHPTPGLKRFPRKGGEALRWIADEACVKAGYQIKTANLDALAGNPVMLSQRCQQLQSQMLAWKRDHSVNGLGVPVFDGTWKALLDIYETDPDSPFRIKLKPRSIYTYTFYLKKLKETIGEVRIDHTDGRMLRRWFAAWGGQEDPSNPRSPYKTLGAATMALAVTKAAISFGVFCRYSGCAEFQLVMKQVSFPSLAPRSHAPTREQMESAGAAAIKEGAPSRSFAYALQFETTVRQTDVIGEWVELSDPRPSAILDAGMKWIGPTWSDVDENLVWTVTHGKTDATSKARSSYDLSVCPMVMDHIKHLPVSERKGPLVVNESTGLPYRYRTFQAGWKRDYAAAGIPKGIWNRDTRAGGNTEAQRAGARLEDRQKTIGHTAGSRTTAQVYDRDTLEAHRRVATARNKKDGE